MIVLLNLVFNCFKSLLSFSADKVTTGTQNLQSVILNPAFFRELSLLFVSHIVLFYKQVITQFSDQVKVKETSQLINRMSNALQTLLKYFNGTIILTFFVPSLYALL